jgi:hypothetical protein
MHSSIYSTKSTDQDGSAYALLRNRSAYIAMSAATVGKLPAHPPVPREKALVPIDDDYGREMAEAFAFRYLES